MQKNEKHYFYGEDYESYEEDEDFRYELIIEESNKKDVECWIYLRDKKKNSDAVYRIDRDKSYREERNTGISEEEWDEIVREHVVALLI